MVPKYTHTHTHTHQQCGGGVTQCKKKKLVQFKSIFYTCAVHINNTLQIIISVVTDKKDNEYDNYNT